MAGALPQRIKLTVATVDDAATIHSLQTEAFLPILEKYQDHETNPANDSIERTLQRLAQPATTYYLIVLEDAPIGAIRVVHDQQLDRARISPMFISPRFQGHGYAQEAIALLEQVVEAQTWELNTIQEEERNCHLYEKLGYTRTGESIVINDRMTIVAYQKQTIVAYQKQKG
ncbi:MAG: GNAT family N-acetyltransferase [Gemmatimonadetes bacterium]|jgi:RimJ/RimL family protein N-acetyltransferase|nr:GNAT family N-acetyltransferase [Gemmatimonadota bacterium]MBT7861713.1 GNAT family N-acetyltransferase [Gemmatimonadota bacterium]